MATTQNGMPHFADAACRRAVLTIHSMQNRIQLVGKTRIHNGLGG